MPDLLTTARALPKIELHRHLEGSLRLQTLLAIALEHHITLPRLDVDSLRPYVQIMPDEPRSWDRFLSKFDVLRQFYRSEAVIRRVVGEVIADAAADNIAYLELRFTPSALNNLIGCDLVEVVGWVCDEAARTAAGALDVRLILSINRHEPTDTGERILEAALAHRANGVVALDLAGREQGHAARPFLPIFERARTEGLGITIHAGEWAGADNVREAITVFGAARIGHGIRAIEDSELLDLLAAHGVTLEVCPTSNVHSGVCPSLALHPLPALVRHGVRTTINTDDPLVSNITLSDEIAAALGEMALTIDEVKAQIMNAAHAAFLDDAARRAQIERFRALLDAPPESAAHD